MTGCTMRHAASTSSERMNRVASPSRASSNTRSYASGARSANAARYEKSSATSRTVNDGPGNFRGGERVHGTKRLHLLVADGVGVERGRCFHDRQREDLHDVVLHDVAHRAGLLVERPAVLDAQLLGHGDLYVVDVATVPQR